MVNCGRRSQLTGTLALTGWQLCSGCCWSASSCWLAAVGHEWSVTVVRFASAKPHMKYRQGELPYPRRMTANAGRLRCWTVR